MNRQEFFPQGVELSDKITPEYADILTPEALEFVAKLARRFDSRRRELLARRAQRQIDLDAGKLPDFLPETAAVRAGDWVIAPAPADLQDRRVEITGPVDRKMVINALNSGASVYMADFEDSSTPTWANVVQGQINLKKANARTLGFVSAEGKRYALGDKVATLMVRPRGWHLMEKHAKIDGEIVGGAFFDFGLYFFHNARALIERGSGPYFYLPKMESHLEARLWNDIFNFAQDELGIPHGTIKATVLIETVLAAFEMDEILYELREHSAGLNCGRWDYIFSFIKKFRNDPAFVLPDRSTVTMDRPFLRSYVELLIQTCHRRSIHAMGGMAAQIPIKNDPVANDAALEKVRRDKLREVVAGHDGTWVAHPGLVAIAKDVFDGHMPDKNQIGQTRAARKVEASDLLEVPSGEITEAGLRWNIDVGLQYVSSWLDGQGCVPIYNLMEDAATAEICRTQVWQWLPHGVRFSDGRPIEPAYVQAIIHEQKQSLNGTHAKLAASLFARLITSRECPEFLTLSAYEHLP